MDNQVAEFDWISIDPHRYHPINDLLLRFTVLFSRLYWISSGFLGFFKVLWGFLWFDWVLKRQPFNRTNQTWLSMD